VPWGNENGRRVQWMSKTKSTDYTIYTSSVQALSIVHISEEVFATS
jgi:hypothetical protein